MQGQPFAEDATRWMAQDKLSAVAGSEDTTPPDPQEARQELRRLLNMLMIDRLKQLETEALTQASTGQDPEAQQRWQCFAAFVQAAPALLGFGVLSGAGLGRNCAACSPC